MIQFVGIIEEQGLSLAKKAVEIEAPKPLMNNTL